MKRRRSPGHTPGDPQDSSESGPSARGRPKRRQSLRTQSQPDLSATSNEKAAEPGLTLDEHHRQFVAILNRLAPLLLENASLHDEEHAHRETYLAAEWQAQRDLYYYVLGRHGIVPPEWRPFADHAQLMQDQPGPYSLWALLDGALQGGTKPGNRSGRGAARSVGAGPGRRSSNRRRSSSSRSSSSSSMDAAAAALGRFQPTMCRPAEWRRAHGPRWPKAQGPDSARHPALLRSVGQAAAPPPQAPPVRSQRPFQRGEQWNFSDYMAAKEAHADQDSESSLASSSASSSSSVSSSSSDSDFVDVHGGLTTKRRKAGPGSELGKKRKLKAADKKQRKKTSEKEGKKKEEKEKKEEKKEKKEKKEKRNEKSDRRNKGGQKRRAEVLEREANPPWTASMQGMATTIQLPEPQTTRLTRLLGKEQAAQYPWLSQREAFATKQRRQRQNRSADYYRNVLDRSSEDGEGT